MRVDVRRPRQHHEHDLRQREHFRLGVQKPTELFAFLAIANVLDAEYARAPVRVVIPAHVRIR